MAIRDVVTMGYGNGTFNGSVNLLPTSGYSIEFVAGLTSSKDTFEPNTFAGDTFAPGNFRGTGPFVGTGQPVRGWGLKHWSNTVTMPEHSNTVAMKQTTNIYKADNE